MSCSYSNAAGVVGGCVLEAFATAPSKHNEASSQRRKTLKGRKKTEIDRLMADPEHCCDGLIPLHHLYLTQNQTNISFTHKDKSGVVESQGQALLPLSPF